MCSFGLPDKWTMENLKIEAEPILDIVSKAGQEILSIYNDPVHAEVVDYKADNSPLTLADQASHQVIARELLSLYPDIPIISEEGKDIPYETRKSYDLFWLVDPLDGTKEFIKRNGEFTVNIALIQGNYPTFGFIYAPELDTYYYGGTVGGAFKIERGEKKNIHVNRKTADRIAVRSRSHASEEEETILKQYHVTDAISKGSSLKFCMVAEGKADLYYRHGPTMEWDTAAGQAVLEAAGGKVLNNRGPDRFSYNKESLLNDSFLCLGF